MSNNFKELDKTKNPLEDILRDLILYLGKKKLIDITSLAESLGIITPTRIIPVYYKYRLNYKDIANELCKGVSILLPISRKNAYHLKKRLKQLTNKDIEAEIVFVAGKKYYMFTIKEIADQIPKTIRYIKQS